MLSIKRDPETKGSGEFIVELTKRSYPEPAGRDRDRVLSDEGAVDTMRYRADQRQLEAMAREIIRALPQDLVLGMLENRLMNIWETNGLRIPWDCDVSIGSHHRLVKREK